MMSYMGGVGGMGGVDSDERQMYLDLILSFVNRLNGERTKTAELTRKLAAATERLELLEMTCYGLFP